MTTLTWIILFSFVGGALSAAVAALFLVLPERPRNQLLPHLVSFATGALLGATFLALLPHAVATANTDVHDITFTVLLGLLAFFVLEKLVLWRHCHRVRCEVHGTDGEHLHQPSPPSSGGMMLLVGDSFHNFVDGILIAAAFMTDIKLGVVTALAVATHEIPQEVGDFAVLLDSGFSRAKAFVFNILTSLTTVVGAVLAYFSLADVTAAIPYVLALAASSFIYVAMADLIPGMHRRAEAKVAVQQFVLIIAGIVVIYIAHSTLH